MMEEGQTTAAEAVRDWISGYTQISTQESMMRNPHPDDNRQRILVSLARERNTARELSTNEMLIEDMIYREANTAYSSDRKLPGELSRSRRRGKNENYVMVRHRDGRRTAESRDDEGRTICSRSVVSSPPMNIEYLLITFAQIQSRNMQGCSVM